MKAKKKTKIVFKDLTSKNLPKFKKSVLKSELTFPEPIRSTFDDYLNFLSVENSVAKVALLNSKYIGNIIGFSPTIEIIEEEGLEGIVENPNTIYVFNFVIDSKYQDKGYGHQLLQNFIKSAKEKGYEKLVGHARQNNSLYLGKKFGAKEKSVHKNWSDTEEDYILCELDLA